MMYFTDNTWSDQVSEHFSHSKIHIMIFWYKKDTYWICLVLIKTVFYYLFNIWLCNPFIKALSYDL